MTAYIFTDGFLASDTTLLNFIVKNKDKLNLHIFGVGYKINYELIENVAKV